MVVFPEKIHKNKEKKETILFKSEIWNNTTYMYIEGNILKIYSNIKSKI